MESDQNRLVVSIASFWELSIKESLGRFRCEGGVDGIYREWIQDGVAELLPIEWRHLSILGDLPWIHRDPFDRLLVAQARREDLTLATNDQNIHRYPELKTIW